MGRLAKSRMNFRVALQFGASPSDTKMQLAVFDSSSELKSKSIKSASFTFDLGASLDFSKLYAVINIVIWPKLIFYGTSFIAP